MKRVKVYALWRSKPRLRMARARLQSSAVTGLPASSAGALHCGDGAGMTVRTGEGGGKAWTMVARTKGRRIVLGGRCKSIVESLILARTIAKGGGYGPDFKDRFPNS